MLKPPTHEERVKRFGGFRWTWDPTPTNPEHIHIREGWAERNIESVRIEPLKRSINLHHLAIKPVTAWLEALEREGLLAHLGPFNGSWAPRFIRQDGSLVQRKAACAVLSAQGRSDRLSNHAWGTALDFDAKRYPLGQSCPPDDPRRDIARVGYGFGIAWGGDYVHRPDPQHFELAAP